LEPFNKDNIKSISNAKNISFTALIKKGIDDAGKSHIIILDSRHLSKPEHFIQLFSARKESFKEDELTLIDFDKKKHTLQIVAYPSQFAKYSFSQICIKITEVKLLR
jgi:hypothetical protein